VTSFERSYLLAEPFLPPLYRIVRRRVKDVVRGHGRSARVLDVGGRKSHYTIGVEGRVTISDLPRSTDLQHELNLGLTSGAMETTRARRSNVDEIVLDDMTRSSLPSGSFDCVVSIEVLEHVAEDLAFVREVARVLKPGGTFVMTTPNGDHVPNTNPDHKRHYTRAGLAALLSEVFPTVDVEYAIVESAFYRLGLRSWSPRRPLWTAASMFGNMISGLESSRAGVPEARHGTQHLFAMARKERS